ncbi:hypothetical protein FE257_000380 [Aspergillus nanangensis]|uniref:Major facilitator superfamily (MFS) profile domain-containing protein n=1 Tax=Aspergillus nanangensis TaxID=2582783 RepID=A0AAD4CUI0_ASPNN|nr:hypothetical protein FE257_000380 [Aspergillus nanangensis]
MASLRLSQEVESAVENLGRSQTQPTSPKMGSSTLPPNDEIDKKLSTMESSDVEKQDTASQLPDEKPGLNEPAESADSLYQPKTLKFWLLIICNFLSLFLVALDRTIIATAIPRITDEFNSLGDIGWYGSAYMLTAASSQLIYGRIYKFYSMKVVFLTSVVIFEIGSAICGAAPNSGAFIAGRAIAGLASAGIFSGCMLIIIPIVPLHKRPMFQGMFGMVFGLASALGPLIGGGFTSSVTWRWCFYINIPIGGFTMAFMILFWHPSKMTREPASVATHIKRLDPLGMFFFIPSIISLLLALQWGGSAYSWNNGRIISLFIIFGVFILAFAAIQILMPETATVPARVITQRSVFCAAFYTFFASSAMMLMVYYLPIWFQTVKLVSPVNSGIYVLPLVLSLVVGSLISGFITQKIGYYVPAMYICPCIMSVGLGLISTLNLDTGSPRWIGYQVLAGFGLGFGLQTGGLVIQRVLPFEDVPTGISIMFFLQQLGGCIFTTVGQTILSNLLISQLSDVPGLQTSDIISEGATKLGSIVPSEYMVVVQQAYNFACTRIFLAALGVTFAALLSSLGVEWKSIKKGKNGQGPSGDAKATKGDA